LYVWSLARPDRSSICVVPGAAKNSETEGTDTEYRFNQNYLRLMFFDKFDLF
jgi:hypothetical protein